MRGASAAAASCSSRRICQHDDHAAGLVLTADYARIKCPSLILAGQHDGDRPPAGVEKVAKQIPGAVFKTVNSGHFMHVHAPELVAAEYGAFLAQHAL